ncbi:hypothetical protein [Nocardioides mangrovi]|uniref:Uncharacterized protein n=1 Tax=Nocardioides mangrovi TaxID=2874580 RepID=A0ABS7U7G6_9ACTN|nr:hypothetical protein [Nocardioides mangrovi]MBZ5736775.1 hypothetical protein [Nocardioides mangrovi]
MGGGRGRELLLRLRQGLLGGGERLLVGIRVRDDVQLRAGGRLLGPGRGGEAERVRERDRVGDVRRLEAGGGQGGHEQAAADGTGALGVHHRGGQRRLDLTGDGLGHLRPRLAGDPARLGGDRGGELAALAGQRAEVVGRHRLLRGPQRLPHLEHLGDLVGLAADQQVDGPGGRRRLAQRLHRGGEVGALELLRPGVPRGRELRQRQPVELVRDREQVSHVRTP